MAEDNEGIAKPAGLPSLLEDVSSVVLSENVKSLPSDASQLSSRTTNYNVVDIVDAIRLGAKFFRDVGIWGGVDANKYKFSIRGTGAEEFSWDGENLTIVGDLTVKNQFTAGHAIDAGNTVAFDSSVSKVFQTRINDIEGVNTALTSSNLFAQYPVGKNRFFDMSDTVKVIVMSGGGGSDVSVIVRIAVDPEDPTAGTVTSASVQASSELDTDAFRLDATQVFAVNLGTGANREPRAGIISGLDTTITVNATANLSSDDGTGIACAPRSSSVALAFYSKAGNASAFSQAPTISGTTVTAAAEQTLFTAGATLTIKGAKRFGDTDFYLLVYEYGGNTYCRVVQFDGSTWAVGSEVSVAAAAIGKGCSFGYFDDTTVTLGYNDGTNHKLVVITRSGTTPTVGSATTIQAAVFSGDATTLYQWGKYTYGLGLLQSTTNMRFYAIDLDGTSFATLGDVLNVTLANATASGAMGVLGRFSPTKGLIVYTGSSGVGNNNTVFFSTVNLGTNFDNYIGISDAAIAKDATGNVTVLGVNEAVTGLTGGQAYYLDTDEHYTTVNIQQGRSGVALSATKIVVK